MDWYDIVCDLSSLVQYLVSRYIFIHLVHFQDIRDTIPQINKQINFLLPFMGFGFNYTWLSLHGYLTFSNSPQQFPEYPLIFPIQVRTVLVRLVRVRVMLTPAQDWPRVEDPSIIAPFYSRCKIGELNGNEGDDGLDEHANKKPGVYFRSVSFYSAQHEFHVTNQSVFRNTQKKRKYLRQAKYLCRK